MEGAVVRWETVTAELYWSNVRERLRLLGQKQEWLAIEGGINLRTMQSQMQKGILPQVDVSARIAKVLGTTSEALAGVSSDQWALDNEDLIRDAKALGPTHLSVVKVIVRALAAEPQPARPMPKHGRTVEQYRDELRMIVEADRAIAFSPPEEVAEEPTGYPRRP